MDLVEAAKVAAPIVGAFLAAWAGAQLGFSRTRKERALDKRLAWHEETIKAIAQYEEVLEQLQRVAHHVVIQEALAARAAAGVAEDVKPTAEDFPKLFAPPPDLWASLKDTETRARACLRLADLYTEGRAALECSTMLNYSARLTIARTDIDQASLKIPWLDIAGVVGKSGTTRRLLQESLRTILELDGAVAAILGPRYRKWRLIRRLNRLKEEIS